MKPTQAELQIINGRLPGTQLSVDQVEVLPFRLFDDRITDRYTVMSIEMMRKLAKDANDGVIAFNSCHRSSSTLPVGRSVESQLIYEGTNTELNVKMYAVIKRPDGTPLEDGKDLADRYNTGAVYACSAGVYVGFYKCSICGNDIRDWQNCDHFPGETYLIDEKPVICTALMTGKDIQNGVAMDCGCYECSAVTAGGVRKASVLTETFSSYDKGADIKEFKKAQFETKNFQETVTLTPYTLELPKEENHMADQDSSLLQKNYELIEAKAKVDVAYASLKGEFDVTKSNLDQVTTKLATIETEFEATKTALASALAEKEEFSKKVETAEQQLAASKDEFETKEKGFEAEKTALESFKAAYIAVVESTGVKINREADYASKTLEELQTLHDEYIAELAKLPAGQQSAGESDTALVVSNSYAGIPDHLFQSA